MSLTTTICEKEVAECPICFDPLFENRVVYLCMKNKDGVKSRCPHYFHQECAEAFSNSGQLRQCPLCRFEFNLLILISEEPEKWFNSVDVTKTGKLNFSEVLSLLMARFDFDWRDLDHQARQNWASWDVDHSGFISKSEFIDRMLPWINEHVSRMVARPPPPSIRTPREWFNYWDEDKKNKLNKHEVSRALAKTFQIKTYDELCALKGLVQALWRDFDPYRSGQLGFNELFVTNGLMETIVANYGYLSEKQGF